MPENASQGTSPTPDLSVLVGKVVRLRRMRPPFLALGVEPATHGPVLVLARLGARRRGGLYCAYAEELAP